MDIYSKIFFVLMTVHALYLAFKRFKNVSYRPSESIAAVGNDHPEMLATAANGSLVVSILLNVCTLAVAFRVPVMSVYLLAFLVTMMIADLVRYFIDIKLLRQILTRDCDRPFELFWRSATNHYFVFKVFTVYGRTVAIFAVLPYVMSA